MNTKRKFKMSKAWDRDALNNTGQPWEAITDGVSLVRRACISKAPAVIRKIMNAPLAKNKPDGQRLDKNVADILKRVESLTLVPVKVESPVYAYETQYPLFRLRKATADGETLYISHDRLELLKYMLGKKRIVTPKFNRGSHPIYFLDEDNYVAAMLMPVQIATRKLKRVKP